MPAQCILRASLSQDVIGETKMLPELPTEIWTEILTRTDLETCLELRDFIAAKSFLREEDARNEFLDTCTNAKSLRLVVYHMKLIHPRDLMVRTASFASLARVQWLMNEIFPEGFSNKGWLKETLEAAANFSRNEIVHWIIENGEDCYLNTRKILTAYLRHHVAIEFSKRTANVPRLLA